MANEMVRRWLTLRRQSDIVVDMVVGHSVPVCLPPVKRRVCGCVRLTVTDAGDISASPRTDPIDAAGVQEQQRVAEARLRQAQKLEAIGTLAGGIAHDFNNILWVISGNNELAMTALPADHPVRRNLQRIEQACNRAQDLVRQILSFSRQGEQQKQPLQISSIVKEALKLLRASLPVTIEIRPTIVQEKAMVLADVGQVNQVLLALCTNAAHAMREEGGVLEVGLERCQLSETDGDRPPELEPGPYVVLTVSDTGEGIRPEIRERIFDPFFTTKPVDQGTGLGLSVTHGIVRSHGGTITVSSHPGQGATFRVYLPEMQPAKPVGAGGDLASLPHGCERVLLVDDEEGVREVVSALLARLGYRVECCARPDDALRRFESDPQGFDMVITDQTMPHLTGDRLATELLRLRADVPIVLLTGHSDRLADQQAAGLGVRALLFKPVSIRELAVTVRNALD
jgi:signal transduction histidine kinase